MRVRSSVTACSTAAAALTSASTARRRCWRDRCSATASARPAPQTRVRTAQWKTISEALCSTSTRRSKNSRAAAPIPAPAYGSRPRPCRATANRATHIGTNWPQNRTNSSVTLNTTGQVSSATAATGSGARRRSASTPAMVTTTTAVAGTEPEPSRETNGTSSSHSPTTARAAASARSRTCRRLPALTAVTLGRAAPRRRHPVVDGAVDRGRRGRVPSWGPTGTAGGRGGRPWPGLLGP